MRSGRAAATAAAVALLAPAAAHGTPSVALSVKAVPIPGFPQTGNLYGAGASLAISLAIAGEELDGGPPPLQSFALSLPGGLRVRPAPFPTCPQTTLETTGQAACPRGSAAGPPGSATLVVSAPGSSPSALGRESVPATVEAFYAPEGAIVFALSGHSPQSLQMFGSARFATIAGGGPFGLELLTYLHLVESPVTPPLPAGARTVSVAALELRLGSALRRNGRASYYFGMPRQGRCPRGGYPFKAELMFARTAGAPEQSVTAATTTPCARRGAPLGPAPAPPPPPPPPLPTPLSGAHGAISAPPAQPCSSQRGITIQVARGKHRRYRRMEVFVDGRRVKVVRGALIARPVGVGGLPSGGYTLRVTLTTAAGNRITGTRTYHACPDASGA